MKKILIFLSLFAVSLTSFAQHTYPGVTLYGTTAGTDRTYRDLQIGTYSYTDLTVSNTPDTITMIPGFVSGAGAVFHKDYYFTVSDTVVLAIKDVSSSYTGSEITLYLTSPNANSLVKFLGYSGFATQWALTGAATTALLTQNHWFIINFKCTGTAWIETWQSQD